MSRTMELLRMFSVCGNIQGRKKVQKIVHLLQCKGYSFGFRYAFHFHGPFSSELKAEIDRLVSMGLVDEREVTSGSYQSYEYQAQPNAGPFVRAVTLPEWAELAKQLSGKSAKELEVMSTIAYLQDCGTSPSEIEAEFMLLKPHLSSLFSEGLAEIDKLFDR